MRRKDIVYNDNETDKINEREGSRMLAKECYKKRKKYISFVYQ